MKTSSHIAAILLACIASALLFNSSLLAQIPQVTKVDGGRFHVQGLAFDKEKSCFYFSFTSAFFKTDIEGRIIGSVSGINGHLGAMTFDPESRKVYASLELKDDVIGRNISEKLGAEKWSRDESRFYVAEIDVDKICALDMKQDDVMVLHLIEEACADYKASVDLGGAVIDHRFACSGIDGVTIAPELGKGPDSRKCLYVAYGIYGDKSRNDNDYNVLLCYPLGNIGKLKHKYFIHTGNTTWGVQNLAYDSSTGKILMAVYKGSKECWPNYDLYSVDVAGKVFKAKLDGVPYFKKKVEQVPLGEGGLKDPATGIRGWRFKWGSTGICPLGDGTFYISVNGTEGGSQFCEATLFRWTGNEDCPFEKLDSR